MALCEVFAGQRSLAYDRILLHLIEETANNLEHIDVLQKQADGRTGEEPSQ